MNIETTENIIWIAVGLLATIQLLYTFIIYNAPHRRIVTERKGKLKASDQRPGISVVIAASDHGELLERHLPLILEQEYEDFEVIVVDDNSKDGTQDILGRLSERYPHLYSTFTSDSMRYISHKKLALMLGIKAAKKEWVVFTEPDCYPTSQLWLANLARHFTDSTDVVLGYCNYERRPGVANRCYVFDTLLQQLRILGLTLLSRGYMGMGRNMAYRKEIFFSHKGYSRHLDLERGEDDLFINEHIPAHRITADVSAQSVVRCISANSSNWRNEKLNRLFIRKKMHSIQPYLLGADTASNILLYIATTGASAICIIQKWWITLAVTTSIWIITTGVRTLILRRTTRDLNERSYLFSLPLLEMLRPWWELSLRLRLLFSPKQAYMRRKS